MAQNKINISPDNLNEWLASVGYLFPSNEAEMERFDALYKGEAEIITDSDVSVERILSGRVKSIPFTHTTQSESTSQFTQYSMAARKGSDLPSHILDKIKKNQENSETNDNSSPEETDQ